MHPPLAECLPRSLARQAPLLCSSQVLAWLMVWCCSVNPARSFGTSAVSHSWTNQWIFWVGPFSGAILAAIIYELLFRTHANSVSWGAQLHTLLSHAADTRWHPPAYASPPLQYGPQPILQLLALHPSFMNGSPTTYLPCLCSSCNLALWHCP